MALFHNLFYYINIPNRNLGWDLFSGKGGVHGRYWKFGEGITSEKLRTAVVRKEHMLCLGKQSAGRNMGI